MITRTLFLLGAIFGAILACFFIGWARTFHLPMQVNSEPLGWIFFCYTALLAVALFQEIRR